MINTELRKRFIAGGIIFSLAIAAHFFTTYRCCGPVPLSNILTEALVIFFYLGWVAMGELKRQGKNDFARSIKIAGLSFLALALLGPKGSTHVYIILIPCALMTYAFFVAMKGRNQESAPSNTNN